MMKAMIKLLCVLVLFVPLTQSFANHTPRIDVPSNAVGIGKAGSTVVAEEGAVVYVKSGSVVLYWPGSVLVHKADAAGVPDCSRASATAQADEDLFVSDSAQACAEAGSVVVAQYGSTIIYEDGVDLVRRPVVRRR